VRGEVVMKKLPDGRTGLLTGLMSCQPIRGICNLALAYAIEKH
jgi:hypothetical protein